MRTPSTDSGPKERSVAAAAVRRLGRNAVLAGRLQLALGSTLAERDLAADRTVVVDLHRPAVQRCGVHRERRTGAEGVDLPAGHVEDPLYGLSLIHISEPTRLGM